MGVSPLSAIDTLVGFEDHYKDLNITFHRCCSMPSKKSGYNANAVFSNFRGKKKFFS
jgi:hypothetical protein